MWGNPLGDDMTPEEFYRKDTDPAQTPEADPGPPDDEIDLVLGDPVVRYRAEQFAAMGFNPPQSRALALDRSVDLHHVRDDLIGKGCEVLTAFRILT